VPLAAFLVQRGANASYSLWAAVCRLKRLKTLQRLIKAGSNSSIADFKGRDAVDIAKLRRLPKQLVSRLETLKNDLR
jgi:hypothetical protein